ncbi:MAG: hypothetical protein M1817_005083 [Caeruleum heppii]|nr:MAG: hypothetical protein M1817_005083 [Caeruleum heppii]
MYDVEEETWNSLPFPADGKSGPEPRSGHEGAGKMRGDVWVFDIASQTWTEAEAGPDERPAARGWFDADVMHRTESDAIVVHGGLDESNERLGDVWMLTLG